MRARGHTLWELLLVVGLIPVVTLVVVPIFAQGQARWTLDGQADKVRAALRLAQSGAIAEGRAWRVQLAGEDVVLEYDDAGSWVLAERLGLTGDVAIDATTLNSDRVLFSPLGAPDGGGDVFLVCGAASRTLRVEAVTGFVRVLPW